MIGYAPAHNVTGHIDNSKTVVETIVERSQGYHAIRDGTKISPSKLPIRRCAVLVQERGHIFTALAVVDQLSGVVDRPPGEFWLPSEFHGSPIIRHMAQPGREQALCNAEGLRYN